MNDILILCYHAVSAAWPADLAVRPQRLERQLEYLLSSGYTAATFTQAITSPPSKRTFAVTFDDGYRSVVELGFPILERLGIPATLFVPSGLIGTGEPMSWPGVDQWLATPHRDELIGASWEQVGQLADAGWEIGSHTRTHPHLPDCDPQTLVRELLDSRLEIERRLRAPCTAIAYPYGAVDTRVVAAADDAGYLTAATLPRERFPWSPKPLLWPRTMVSRDDSDAAYRRHVSRSLRLLRSSTLWAAVTSMVPRIRAAQRRLAGHRRTEGHAAPTPALRLCAQRGRLVTGRGAVLAAGALARAGITEALILWPSLTHPMFIIGARHGEAAEWLRRMFEPGARWISSLDPSAWNVARAAAVVLAPSGTPGLAVAERALGRPFRRPRLAVYSPTGGRLSKATCFVFEGDAPEPELVIKALPQIAYAARLRHEVEVVEQLRERVGPDSPVAAALPLPPLAVEEHDGDYWFAQALDPLARFTARPSRDAARDWLRAFHAATAQPPTAWGAADREDALSAVEFGWSHAHPARVGRVVDQVSALLDTVDGLPAPWSALHGDFWRGNVAADGDRLRVYDWEWARLRARPFLDIWTQELAELRERAQRESDAEFARNCGASLPAVESELDARGIDPRFAPATLAPALARLSFRVRAVTGEPAPNEAGAARIMTVVEQLLFGDDR